VAKSTTGLDGSDRFLQKLIAQRQFQGIILTIAAQHV
jgi:hypothetical protein